jgi:hypothetical protein
VHWENSNGILGFPHRAQASETVRSQKWEPIRAPAFFPKWIGSKEGQRIGGGIEAVREQAKPGPVRRVRASQHWPRFLWLAGSGNLANRVRYPCAAIMQFSSRQFSTVTLLARVLTLASSNVAVLKKFHGRREEKPRRKGRGLSWDSWVAGDRGCPGETRVETGAGSLWRGGGLNRDPGPGF